MNDDAQYLDDCLRLRGGVSPDPDDDRAIRNVLDTLAARERELAEARENLTKTSRAWRHLAEDVMGLTTPLELVARADSDKETYADILVRMVDDHIKALRADLAAVEAVRKLLAENTDAFVSSGHVGYDGLILGVWTDPTSYDVLESAPTLVALGRALLAREADDGAV